MCETISLHYYFMHFICFKHEAELITHRFFFMLLTRLIDESVNARSYLLASIVPSILYHKSRFFARATGRQKLHKLSHPTTS